MNKRFQIWLEHHIDAVVSNYEKDRQKIADAIEEAKVRKDDALILTLNAELLRIEENHKEVIKDESARLDKFLELLRDSSKKPTDAEREAFDVSSNFYLKIKQEEEKERRQIEEERRRQEREKRRKEREKKRKTQEAKTKTELIKSDRLRQKRKIIKKRLLNCKYYLESAISREERERLLARRYLRLKISPYGTSGASYYWVKTRYNESKEHAFFCYLVEEEVRKFTKNVTMNVNNGPDVVFKHNEKEYCFEVETGINLKKNKERFEDRFFYYERNNQIVFIFVTKKSLKYKYARFGTVVTRNTFREAIERIFAPT